MALHSSKGEGMHSKFSGEFENLPKQKQNKKKKFVYLDN